MTESAPTTLISETHQNAVEKKLNRMYWTDRQAKQIGEFLQGNAPNKLNDSNQTWKNIKEETEFTGLEVIPLLKKARQFREDRITRKKTRKINDPKDTEEVEFQYSAPKRSLVIQQIIEPALRKAGIFTSNESRRIVSDSRTRPIKKKVFSQTEKRGKDVTSLGYLPPDEGGPEIINLINPPPPESTKNISDSRVRRSLAHEINHELRALTNKAYWKGFEEKAKQQGLKQSIHKSKRKYIGGFHVGSNMQGSESLGELFSVVVHLKAKTGKEPVIDDLISEIENRFIKKLRKFEKGVIKYENSVLEAKAAGKAIPDAPQNRYLVARLAFLHHAKQLQEQGYGKVPARDLVALCTFGYTSFEKAPYLIEAGILTQVKYQKMREVIQNVEEWLTSKDEKGFTLKDSQNI